MEFLRQKLDWCRSTKYGAYLRPSEKTCMSASVSMKDAQKP